MPCTLQRPRCSPKSLGRHSPPLRWRCVRMSLTGLWRQGASHSLLWRVEAGHELQRSILLAPQRKTNVGVASGAFGASPRPPRAPLARVGGGGGPGGGSSGSFAPRRFVVSFVAQIIFLNNERHWKPIRARSARRFGRLGRLWHVWAEQGSGEEVQGRLPPMIFLSIVAQIFIFDNKRHWKHIRARSARRFGRLGRLWRMWVEQRDRGRKFGNVCPRTFFLEKYTPIRTRPFGLVVPERSVLRTRAKW